MSIASHSTETAQPIPLSGAAPRSPARARRGAAGVVVLLAALLSACGTSGSGGSSTTGGGAATATTAPTTFALPTAVHVSPADTASLCGGAFGSNAPSVYAFSQSLYAESAFAYSYPSYVMPANTPPAPFKLGSSLDSPALSQIFGGDASANPAISQPGGITFSICNNGATPLILAGVGMGIASFTPHASPIDTWQICDGAYQPSAPGIVGGCGGGVLADENVRVIFQPNAGQGAAVGATPPISADGPNGYGPLPVTLQPGHTIMITFAVTMPTAPGIYILAPTLAGTGVPHTLYAPLPPRLFASVAHKWSGASCKATAMLNQIPASDTSSYYICPA